MEYKKGTFSTVPIGGLSKIRIEAQACYMWLCFYVNSSGNCFPKQKTLATKMGVSPEMVKKLLNELCSAGMIIKKERFEGKRQTSNEYTIIIKELEKEEQEVGYDCNGGGVTAVTGEGVCTERGEGLQPYLPGTNPILTKPIKIEKYKKENTEVIQKCRELQSEESPAWFPRFLYYFLSLGWKPGKDDTMNSVESRVRRITKNGGIITNDDAIEVFSKFYDYWDSRRDQAGFSKKNWLSTLVNSWYLPNHKKDVQNYKK